MTARGGSDRCRNPRWKRPARVCRPDDAEDDCEYRPERRLRRRRRDGGRHRQQVVATRRYKGEGGGRRDYRNSAPGEGKAPREMESLMTRRAFFLLTCTAALLVSLSLRAADKPAAANTLTDDEKKAGWKLLFDGRSADAWRAYRGKGLPPEWRVAAGGLQLHDKGGELAAGIGAGGGVAGFELSLEGRGSQGGGRGGGFFG